MTTSGTNHVWAIGDAYEPYVGRWSRLVARSFLDWLAVPAGGRWLDVGCGTGALSTVVLERCSPSSVVGIDPSDGFLAYARAHVADDRVRFETGDARALASPDAAFDAVVAGLSLNFVADPVAAIVEMTRVARPGGIVGAYVWDYAGGMEMMRHFWRAAAALDPAARAHDEGSRFASICRPDALAELFSEGGLRGVEARAVDIPTVFRDFDDYWKPFLGGQGVAPAYAKSLSQEHREELRTRLRAALPMEPDGRIALTARAWAVQGAKVVTSR